MTVDRSPGEGRYARVEREQRWLLTGLPAGAHDPVSIVDRYLTGSTLRLRVVTSGDHVVGKLARRCACAPTGPSW